MRKAGGCALGCGLAFWLAASGVAWGSWPQYLGGPQHASVSGSAAFTPSSGAPRVGWQWAPPIVSGAPRPDLDATPIVSGGRVFVGARSGGLYALDAATGVQEWQRQLDVTQPLTCMAARGITGTPAVVKDSHDGVLTLYAVGARYLYALRPSTGAVRWRTRIGSADPPGENAYYNWSSPTVVAGHIYVGLSSQCDDPLIRGGVVELDQHTGKVLHTWYAVPAGSIGASVWSSVAATADGTRVWVTTGNDCGPTLDACPQGNQVGDSLSLVELSGALQRRGGWQIPNLADRNSDFGSSPTLWSGGGTAYVGACNKNGVYYAFARNPLGSQPRWTRQIGVPADGEGGTGACLASAVWDNLNHRLFLAGNQTSIDTTTYGGSVLSVAPTTGTPIWQTGLPCAAIGTPSLNRAGVLAVTTLSACVNGGQPAVYLLDASTGTILTTLVPGAKTFAQPVFDGTKLFIATETQGLYAFNPN